MKLKVGPRNDCDIQLMAYSVNLITTIQVNILPPISLKASLLNFKPLTYHFSPWTLILQPSRHSYFKGATPLLQLRCFGIDITSFCNNIS